MTTTQKPRLAKVRTPSQIKADATLLLGATPQPARAAADDDSPPDDQGTVGELWLYGVVGGWWRGFDAESVANALRGLDVDTLYVRIHSPGGHASDGIAISNLLRNHRARVVVVVDGLAASAASVIAVAGDEIVMCPGSQMMLHDASTGMWGNADDLLRASKWIGSQSQNYAGVYAFKAGGTPAEWREVMLADNGWGTWYTADEAVAAGLADVVGTRPAAGSPPTAPEDELDDDEDALARIAHDLLLLEQHVHPAARAAWQGKAPKPPTASAGGSVTTEGGTAVAFSDAQLTTMRDKLELPADADEATIVAAVASVVEESLEDRPPATAGVPEGSVVVSKVEWEETRGDAQRGAAAALKLHEMQREAALDANRDKFLPANRAAWREEYDKNPKATIEALEKRPVVIPVDELGHDLDEPSEKQPTSVAGLREDPSYTSWEL